MEPKIFHHNNKFPSRVGNAIITRLYSWQAVDGGTCWCSLFSTNLINKRNGLLSESLEMTFFFCPVVSRR